MVVLDGVFVRGADGRLSFRRVVPRTADIEGLVAEIAEACEAWLARQGHGTEEPEHVEEDDGLALLQAASVRGYVAVGPRARRPVRRVQRLGGREVRLPPRTAACDGYNLGAGGYSRPGRRGGARWCRSRQRSRSGRRRRGGRSGSRGGRALGYARFFDEPAGRSQ